MNEISRPSQPNLAVTSDSSVIPVILSGGSGTRLWPVSRESFPKQFWGLINPDQSLIVQTALRGRVPASRPPFWSAITSIASWWPSSCAMPTSRTHASCSSRWPQLRPPAPDVAAAALLVAQINPQSVIWMMAADSAIEDVGALHARLEKAVAGARTGRIVTLGVRPSGPETGYGYMEVGAAVEGAPGVHAVARFIEKPEVRNANPAGQR